jgi:hypothetical protein
MEKSTQIAVLAAAIAAVPFAAHAADTASSSTGTFGTAMSGKGTKCQVNFAHPEAGVPSGDPAFIMTFGGSGSCQA